MTTKKTLIVGDSLRGTAWAGLLRKYTDFAEGVHDELSLDGVFGKGTTRKAFGPRETKPKRWNNKRLLRGA